MTGKLYLFDLEYSFAASDVTDETLLAGMLPNK